MYDEYWRRPDRFGSHSFEDADPLLQGIRKLEPEKKILDIGCGMGYLVDSLASHGHDAHGLDVSSVAIEHCQQNCKGSYKRGSLLSIPYPDKSFDTVISTDCLEHIAEQDISKAISEISRVTKRQAYMRIATRIDRDKKWHLVVKKRRWWENRFLSAGFRKHPVNQEITTFEELNNERIDFIAALQKIPDKALSEYPLFIANQNREVRADMLRESNRRSDAHIARYQLARSLCQSKGRVIDIGCGLGYGSAILAQYRANLDVCGIDHDLGAINYANSNYSSDRLKFIRLDAHNVCTKVRSSSVDLVVLFETLHQLENPEKIIISIKKTLKQGGLFLCSVPNLWLDESGQDPNPRHLRAFSFESLENLIDPHLEIVERYSQIAGNGNRFPDMPRTLRKISKHTDHIDEPAEWCLLLARKGKP